MKRATLLLILIACPFAHAQELEIELPRAAWLLAPLSPPRLRQEGIALITETLTVQELMPLLASQEYESALALLKESEERILVLLESGDPLGLVGAQAAAGPPAPVRPGQVSAALLYLIGHTYLALDQYLPAETAFRNALVALPDYLRVHESLGLLYLRNERYDEARVHLARAAELGLHTPNLFGALGFLNQATHNYWGAASAYQQAMILEPDNEQWRRGLLFALAETHQYDSGLTLVEQMLQDDVSDPDLWLYRSHMSLQAGERDVALTSLETAIRLGDISAANLQVCATLHMELGSIRRAIELLRASVIQGLEFEFVEQALNWLVLNDEWDYLAELLAALRERWDTLTEVQQSRILSREASVNLSADDEPAASTALEQALELDPGNADALMTLGNIHANNRNYTEAELLFQRASAYDRYRDSALISLAQIAIDQDDFARALEFLRDVVIRNPARTDLRRTIDSLENLVLLRTAN